MDEYLEKKQSKFKDIFKKKFKRRGKKHISETKALMTESQEKRHAVRKAEEVKQENLQNGKSFNADRDLGEQIWDYLNIK